MGGDGEAWVSMGSGFRRYGNINRCMVLLEWIFCEHILEAKEDESAACLLGLVGRIERFRYTASGIDLEV